MIENFEVWVIGSVLASLGLAFVVYKILTIRDRIMFKRAAMEITQELATYYELERLDPRQQRALMHRLYDVPKLFPDED